MSTNDDALVPFQNVRIMRSTAIALLCRIGARRVWLPRQHIRGRIFSTGDRGDLGIRHWVARDRGLLDHLGNPSIAALAVSRLRPLVTRLRLVHRPPTPVQAV